MTELNKLTQTEYDRLLNRLAGVLQTQRGFIEIEDVTRRNDASRVCYRVKRKGVYYSYMIEERSDLQGNRLYQNLGFVIWKHLNAYCG